MTEYVVKSATGHATNYEAQSMATAQKMNVQKAIKSRLQGKSLQTIATEQGVNKSTVQRCIVPILKQLANPEQVEYYRKNQAQILDGLAAKTVASICNEDFEKASLQQKVVSIGVLTDKSRLVSGQSTQNHAIAAFFQAVVESADGDRG